MSVCTQYGCPTCHQEAHEHIDMLVRTLGYDGAKDFMRNELRFVLKMVSEQIEFDGIPPAQKVKE